MLKHFVTAAIVWTCGLRNASAQAPVKIDFGREVQPLFKTHCVECHGPKQQKNGFRLDRRRDAMRGGTGTMIGPGNSVASRLYLRLTGDRYGPQMPPEGPLSPEQLNMIKAWIDQGAHWPDDLAGEMPSAPPDPKVGQIMEALRQGDRSAFKKMLREGPKIAKLQGPGGSTPLMYAVLYADADSIQRLLECGADPNTRNEAGATALMWAVDDPEKTRLLLKAGADVEARSEDGQTPLLIATGRFGASDVVKLLLDHGANPSAKTYGFRGASTPLRQAASAGDEAVLRMLIERGANSKSAGIVPLIAAINTNNTIGVEILLKSVDRAPSKESLLSVLPSRGNPTAWSDTPLIEKLFELGADANAKDAEGRTVLILAASSDSVSLKTIQALIDRGADIHAKSDSGETVLDYAMWQGQTPLMDLLMKAGAKRGDASTRPILMPKPAGSVRAALARSIPLLQRTDVVFLQKAGCVSCHHNSLTAETVALARKNGFPVDEEIARKQLTSIAAYTELWRERMLQGIAGGGEATTVSSILIGMAAERHAPDPATDAWARYLKDRQSKNGRWSALADRPPSGARDIKLTAESIGALQVYGVQAQRLEYQKAIQRAAEWLRKAQPMTLGDRVFQLLGLSWAGRNEEIIRQVTQDILSEQRADGGWAQLPSLASDAFATGQALAAMKEAGAIATTDAAYQRGVQFLLNTQLEDGSWYVRSRSIPFQPYFESGFPHGRDQWISASATNWASRALVHATR